MELTPKSALDTVDPSVSVNEWSIFSCILSRSFKLLFNFVRCYYSCVIYWFIYFFHLFISECILPGSLFWGLWSRRDNSVNYYRAFITRITASHINFLLQINNKQRRSYKRTEPVLVVDKISNMKEISVNSSVIAVHRPDKPECYRAGNVTGTNERLSLVTVKFKNGDQKWVPVNQLRLVKRPKFCVDRVWDDIKIWNQ